MAIVELHNVKFNYPDKRMLFGSFDLSIEEGELIFLMGANGSGKSTLLKLILGAEQVSDGNVTIDQLVNATARKRASKIAYVPQDRGLDPEMNAEDIFNFIGSAHKLNRSILSVRKSEIYSALGIEKFKEKRLKYLSGGQRQLVNIGAGLLHDPKILLLDEPFVGLDYGSKSAVISLLRSLNKSLICITHDIDFAESNADKILLLEQGKLIEYKEPKEMVEAHPYFIAEIDFKQNQIPNYSFQDKINSRVQFKRQLLSVVYEQQYIEEIEHYIQAYKQHIDSVKTFGRNLKSTLVGQYQMSFTPKQGKQKKKNKK